MSVGRTFQLDCSSQPIVQQFYLISFAFFLAFPFPSLSYSCHLPFPASLFLFLLSLPSSFHSFYSRPEAKTS